MSVPQVVILSTRSLFVEGVASRLRQHLPEQAMQVVDARRQDALAQVVAAHPASVIVDAADPEATHHCSLSDLFNAMPLLTVIRLDPQHEQIQVVTSQKRQVDRVHDLVTVIQAAIKEEGGDPQTSTV